MLLFSSLVLFGAVFSKVRGGTYIMNEEADELCLVYKKTCPENKACAVQHVTWPRNMTFPVCVPTTVVIVKSKNCELPPAPGKCQAQHRRWYYNRHSLSCAWFYYTGCHGNANNFASKAGCEEYCISRPVLAQLKAATPLVLSVPDEIIIPPQNTKGEPLSIRKNGRKRKHNRKERKRLKQKRKEIRKMWRRYRKHRRHQNRPENNLTVDNSPAVSDQTKRHYSQSGIGQTRKFKLFSILDRDSGLRSYSKS